MTVVILNVVCFRYTVIGFDKEKLNLLNKEILMTLHETGIASPSFTILNRQYCIRIANVNHRSKKTDADLFIRSVIEIGDQVSNNFIGPA